MASVLNDDKNIRITVEYVRLSEILQKNRNNPEALKAQLISNLPVIYRLHQEISGLPGVKDTIAKSLLEALEKVTKNPEPANIKTLNEVLKKIPDEQRKHFPALTDNEISKINELNKNFDEIISSENSYLKNLEELVKQETSYAPLFGRNSKVFEQFKKNIQWSRAFLNKLEQDKEMLDNIEFPSAKEKALAKLITVNNAYQEYMPEVMKNITLASIQQNTIARTLELNKALYNRIEKTLTETHENNERNKMLAFVQKTNKSAKEYPSVYRQSFDSIAIMPSQRGARYELLAKTILDNFEKMGLSKIVIERSTGNKINFLDVTKAEMTRLNRSVGAGKLLPVQVESVAKSPTSPKATSRDSKTPRGSAVPKATTVAATPPTTPDTPRAAVRKGSDIKVAPTVSEEEKRNQQRKQEAVTKIFEELISTERSYLKSLDALLAQEGAYTAVFKEKTKSILHQLKMNAELSRIFLKKLDNDFPKNGTPTDKLLFVNNLYRQYIPKIIKTITETAILQNTVMTPIIGANRKKYDALEVKLAKEKDHQRFETVAIMPVQRGPRYELLAKAMLENMEKIGLKKEAIEKDKGQKINFYDLVKEELKKLNASLPKEEAGDKPPEVKKEFPINMMQKIQSKETQVIGRSPIDINTVNELNNAFQSHNPLKKPLLASVLINQNHQPVIYPKGDVNIEHIVEAIQLTHDKLKKLDPEKPSFFVIKGFNPELALRIHLALNERGIPATFDDVLTARIQALSRNDNKIDKMHQKVIQERLAIEPKPFPPVDNRPRK